MNIQKKGCNEACWKPKYSFLKLFLANCRSLRGKTNDLASLTVGYNIICSTETHIDNTVDSKIIFDIDDHNFNRKDRTINGGGALIAVHENLQPKQIKLPEVLDELIFVRIYDCISLGCYYRLHQGKPLRHIYGGG